MSALKLYELERSGNCYKVRLFLSLLGLPYDRITVDLAKGEQHKPEYLALNPLHQVPLLIDGDVVVRDSQAILVYLAAKHGQGQWYPADPVGMGAVQQWLSYTSNEILNGLATTRAIKLGIRPGDLAKAQEVSRGILAQLEQALTGQDWLALGTPTIADIAAYPYVAMIPVGGIALEPYPHIQAWTARIEALPGYLALPQVAAPQS
jgi:glutathione S-transferase